jgi:hypothetical protein
MYSFLCEGYVKPDWPLITDGKCFHLGGYQLNQFIFLQNKV